MRKRMFYLFLTLTLILGVLTGCGGESADGWVERADGKYYKNAGTPVTGWQELDGSRYYFGSDGKMATGWLMLSDGRYYLDENGILQTGWITVDGREYCLDTDGKTLSGWTERDGQRCYLNQNGTPASGWLKEADTYYLDESGIPVTGWQDFDGLRYFFRDDGTMLTGWTEFFGQKFHFDPKGIMQTGWAWVDGSRYYFAEGGAMQTGWILSGDFRYYIHPNGAVAAGPTEIDGVVRYFSPNGIYVPLVNPWNPIAEDYTIDLSYMDATQQIATVCYDDLMRMLSDCAAAGNKTLIVSGYRTQEEQEFLYYRKVHGLVDKGYSWNKACAEAAKEVAIPGTSEHQLGLAVDIMDANYPYLNEYQANTAAQKWLMENCHKYGFILRYPIGTTAVTGIIFEPWHYRYVGTEIAWELHRTGQTLEEYLGAVKRDG